MRVLSCVVGGAGGRSLVEDLYAWLYLVVGSIDLPVPRTLDVLHHGERPFFVLVDGRCDLGCQPGHKYAPAHGGFSGRY